MVKIVDKVDEQRKLNVIVLWKQETLQEIKKKSGKLADKSEYQVHYWALNLVKDFDNGEKLVIQIPLVIFNYPQTVTGVSISFSLTDVEQISNGLEDLVKEEAKKAVAELTTLFEEVDADINDFKVEVVSLNTLHRHP